MNKPLQSTNGSVYLIRKVKSSNRILRKYAEVLCTLNIGPTL